MKFSFITGLEGGKGEGIYTPCGVLKIVYNFCYYRRQVVKMQWSMPFAGSLLDPTGKSRYIIY